MNHQWYPEADLLIKNIKIYTVALTIEEIKAGKTEFPIIQNGFVAAKDGKTIAMGEGLDVSVIGKQTAVIDGAGLVLMPGFIDCHIHAVFTGLDMLNVDLKDAFSKNDFLKKLKDRVDITPKGLCVVGNGWNELLWDTKTPPTREDLDAISTNHPIICSRICHHVYVANSKALEMAGITDKTPNPEDGVIGRDNTGVPNGLIYENHSLMQNILPVATEERLITAIETFGHVLNSYGITSCIDANLEPVHMRAYVKANELNRLHFRSNLMLYLDKAQGDIHDQLRRIKQAPFVTGFGNNMVKVNALKILFDGVPSTGTACMRKPYEHMPETSGFTTISDDEIRAIILLAAEYGWQCGIHCCGDKAADIVIDAYEEAFKKNSDLRNYIIHHAVIQNDQFSRLKELNIPIASQPTIALLMGEQPVIGKEMSNRYLLGKSYFDHGIIIGGSSDSPVVSCDPLLGMYAAITRYGADGQIWNAQERLTPVQALIMWTKNAAYFSHDDQVMGSVEIGNAADYVILDTPILEVEPERIKSAKVLRTILGGETVFKAH